VRWWQWVFCVIGAWALTSFGAALMWVGWLEWATRRDCRRRDLPIKGDDTIARLERSTWDRR